jgi:pimeloyl-ACP methyl ester carboxylesterase
MRMPLPIRAIPALAERAWFTPPPLSPRRRARWEETLDGTDPFELELDGRTFTGFTVGEGPLVVLVHGWGGRASQMATIGHAAAAAGFRAVALDAPGHGEAKWDTTNVFEMALPIRALVAGLGSPHAVVAHSLGAMVTLHALGDDRPGLIALLAPVLDVEEVLEVFSERAHLMPWTAASLRRRIRAFVGEHWDEFAAGPKVDLGDSEVLIVHDPDDDDTSFATSAALAAVRPRTYLHVARSVGHNGLLGDPEIASVVTGFVAAGAHVLRAIDE